MKHTLTSLVLGISLLLGSVSLSWSSSDQKGAEYWEKSQKYFAEGKSLESDFYLAIYLQLGISNPQIQIPDLFKKLDKRKIPSLYFVDGNYSNEFLASFFGDTLFNWKFQFNKRHLVIATSLGNSKEKNLYAAVWGQPQLTRWSVIKNNKSRSSYLLGYKTAYINIGQYDLNRRPLPCDSLNIKGFLTKVYEPSFFDLNGDGLPELLVRYNQAVADGFIQKMRVYQSANGKDLCKPNLIKEFSARNGFILNAGKIFKVGTQTKGNENESWLGASAHQVREIDYNGKTEKVLKTATVTNVLRGSDAQFWK